jgi:type IV pilus assembly protein PilB
MHGRDDVKQKARLHEIHEKEEEELVKILAPKYGMTYADLTKMSVDLDYLKLLPEDLSRQGKIVVFQGVGTKIQVGMRQPNLEIAQNIIKDLENKGYEIQQFLVSTVSLERVWVRYKEVPEFIELTKGIIDISPERIDEIVSSSLNMDTFKEIFKARIQSGKQRKISELVEIILGGALGMDASDIHTEPREHEVRLRFRLDGVLHDVIDFEQRAYQLVLSRIKLVSEMKLNVKDKPQDGRFTIKAQGVEIEVRASTLPGPYGESIVLRILNPKSIRVEFSGLGMHPTLEKIMAEELNKPNGMILNTGPTGSGKTTTLYAFLNHIKSPEVKIITLEEPIEYHLEGITQTQTKPEEGYTFASGLRSILRQDPDVIMVGEIRDLEAASIALNAALTGHLVLSTLHTNDSAGTVPRLIDLGANPAIIAPAINIAMAQRLVRQLCDFCKTTYDPTPEEKEIITKIVETFPPGIEKPDLSNFKLYKSPGCPKCSNIGYKGRIAIFEAIKIDDELEELVMHSPSITEIRKNSIRQEILNMQQDAVIKILNGITSIEETKRVIEL